MHAIDIKITINQIADIIANNTKLELSENAKQRIVACRVYLDNKINNSDAPFYGINTGFGSLCNTQISKAQLSQLQENLLLSHACGTGDLVDKDIVKIMLLLKIQSLSYGHSAVQLETVERLVYFFNNNILPVVYQLGSLGASGDLAPLAHLCLPLLGKGNVWVNENNIWVEKDANLILAEGNLKPIVLQSKEGLALINGTQFMSAYAVKCLIKSHKLYNWANTTAAISIEGFDARIDPFNELLHNIRPHFGQVFTANAISNLLAGSEIIAQTKAHVQDPYAFRCVPQVHGASLDTLNYVTSVVETEINSVTDNPNIFPEEDLILSGGNFHGQPLALVLDFLAIAMAELGSISERRTYQLISGLRGLPPFLITNAGLNSGFMIPQYTAASIVSQNKQLCTPASVDSIVSSNGQEDHVSMGANAATKCLRVVNNLERILAIELMNAAQAIEFRAPLKTSAVLQTVVNTYRFTVPTLENDRFLHDDIEKSIQFLQEFELEII